MTLEQVFLPALAYFAGAIPTGYLIARHFFKMDIRQHGSGNPGAANIYRTCGKAAGFATFILDACKGYLPVIFALHRGHSLEFGMATGLLAVFGHIWTIFLKFRGGKGVATAAGVCVALLPIPTLIALAIFVAALGATGHISMGSILAAAAMPAASFALGSPPVLAWGTLTICGIILIRHISNMKRMLSGMELRFNLRK
jgi:glycerol-3-phosphate acyltransferase PlsY